MEPTVFNLSTDELRRSNEIMGKRVLRNFLIQLAVTLGVIVVTLRLVDKNDK